MTCREDPDQHLVTLNLRARLMRQAADQVRSPLLAEHLRETAERVATEAMMLVADYGAERAECHYHGDPTFGEDPDQVYVGWALQEGEVRTG
ncbi:MAG TPA: hypothetical protein VG276_28115 [Actinomycetes bacterium]|jgi:hypothetical protein|nr:hypothetical protein [Actinomycetes bacterium]